jgi:hypothetical protein
MAFFDASLSWMILAPLKPPAAQKAAAELSRYIYLLRRRAGLTPALPPVADAYDAAPPETVPVILLNAESGGRESNGFTWRAGGDRIEIYGQSGRGLRNGVFDFLAALGLRWPEPDREILPPPPVDQGGKYALRVSRAHKPARTDEAGDAKRRLFMDPEASPKSRKSRIIWAARNGIDVLVVSLRDKILNKGSPREGTGGGGFPPLIFTHSRRALLNLIKSYALEIEGGGWDLSLLVPRRYFFLHRDLFRMDSGRRSADHHFCATNPDTIRIIRGEGEKIFRANPGVEIFHLWPDRGHEKTWCSCPTCRAFTPAEQNRIAVNAAADALAAVNPRGRISFYEEGEGGDIPLRPNLFRLETLPETAAGTSPWVAGNPGPEE